ncbi:protein takeout-like [Periplaneta americana]|uniref:protein takeout-like n=1 Tax=Periplaneta americana TaxID=6978 RepID=UPI0037E998BC
MRSCWVGLLLVGVVGSASLPPYLKPCVRTDPNFNACALEHGNEAIPGLLRGDKKYQIPNLNPLNFDQIKVAQSGLTLTFKDVKIFGLDQAQLENIDMDFDKQHFALWFNMPLLNLLAKYDIKGRLLVLPITGNGDSNITLVNNKFKFDVDFTKEDIKGNVHAVLKNPAANLTPGRMYVHLDNLFGGDNLLGTETNNFLNENWLEVFKDVGPSITEAIAQLLGKIINNISAHFPYDDLFPEK